MTKAQLIDKIHKSGCHHENKKVIEEIVDLAVEEIRKAIKKEKRFVLVNFGTFTVRHRKARNGVNPNTGAPMKIPASKTVGFKPSPIMKKGL